MTDEQHAAYRRILEEVVATGHAQLMAGMPGEVVVVETIRLLEDSPLFNAGVGAVLTWEGEHELDASIMHGGTRNAGAVAGVKTVRSPITLAAAVMEVSPHVMLTGEGAEAFALSQGFEPVDNSTFTTERRQQQLEKLRAKTASGYPDAKFGTVGVTVLDAKGDLVAGTSTGGMTGKRFGRVGDSPIIGAGTWADNDSCAVSATGHGEYFIRYHVAADICARMQYQGLTLDAAASRVINEVLVEAGGDGGIVAVDKDGNTAMVFNTEGMYRASIDAAGTQVIGIYAEAEEN